MSTESTLLVSIARTTAPVALLNGATLICVASSRRMSASFPGVSVPTLWSSPFALAPPIVASFSTSRVGQQLRAMLLEPRVGDREVEEVLLVLEPALEREARRASA